MPKLFDMKGNAIQYLKCPECGATQWVSNLTIGWHCEGQDNIFRANGWEYRHKFKFEEYIAASKSCRLNKIL